MATLQRNQSPKNGAKKKWHTFWKDEIISIEIDAKKYLPS